jgi:hypothetical protein
LVLAVPISFEWGLERNYSAVYPVARPTHMQSWELRVSEVEQREMVSS